MKIIKEVILLFDSYCLDDKSKRVYYVTQWDSNIELYSPKIFGYPESSNLEIHIYNSNQNSSFVLNSSLINNSAKIIIPNILLTENCPIIIYIYLKSTTGNKSIKEIRLPVRKKKKPDDYVYTPTDIKTWNDKVNKSGWSANKYLGTDENGNVIEKNGGGGGGDGKDGATFTPIVSSSGIISWKNDKNLPNPTPVNLTQATIDALNKWDGGNF